MHLFKLSICILFTILVVAAVAQENPLNQLHDQFIRYQENALQEKIFVHISKDNFFPGETMFFKVYAVDGMVHKPLDLNRVAYIEILNSNNQPVVQQKVALKNGTGNGSLDIPDTLSTGRYRIITYTSWMRNFSAEFFFSKDISIINPLNRSGTNNLSNQKPVIRFFPEGGNLVYGLTSKVAFQATDANGQGIDFKGVIVDEHYDTLAHFIPLKFGIGNFSFTPQKGKSYRAVINTKEGSVISELPVPYDEGYVLNIRSENDGSELKINIRSTKAEAKEVYLFVHNRGRIRKSLTAPLNSSGLAMITIPVQEMEEGISHITLFDYDLKPVAERLYFKQPDQLLKIKVDVAQSTYARRESASLALSTQASDNQPVSANVSLSLFKIDNIQGFDSTSIVSYLLLTSDLKGKVENPYYYFAHPGEKQNQAIDNLMLTHGWSRFTWQDVLKEKWPVIPFNPDYEGMTIRAKITDDNDAPIAYANVLLSTASNGTQLYAGMSNARGLLTFYTRNLYGKNEIILQQIGRTSKVNFTLIDPYSENYPTHTFRPYTVSKTDEKLIRSYNIHSQVQKGFSPNPFAPILIDSIPRFGLPDKSFLLSDYVEFPLVKDVLTEYVFEVIVRKQENKFHLYTLDKTTQKFFQNEPLILIDGVPVFDSDRIINLPAKNIKKLDLINRKIFYGLFTFNGIVSFTSHTGQFSGIKINPEAVVFDYEGLQRQQEFYSPIHNQSGEERLPDFRNVLLWAPDLNTDATGKGTFTFTTSDLPGEYIGVVNGLTNNGLPGFATFMIKVK